MPRQDSPASSVRLATEPSSSALNCTVYTVRRGISPCTAEVLIPDAAVPYHSHPMTDPLVIDRSNSYPSQEVPVLNGPLTASNSATFQNAMRREDPAETIILDLSEVPYIDSAGLGLLVTAYVTRQKSGRKMVLSGINPRVQRLFEITKVASLFLTFSSPEEAIAALNSAGKA